MDAEIYAVNRFGLYWVSIGDIKTYVPDYLKPASARMLAVKLLKAADEAETNNGT